MNTTMSATRRNHNATWTENEPLSSSSHHFERQRRFVHADVDFPNNNTNVKVDHADSEKQHDEEQRMSTALRALEKEIKYLELEMIQAGQAGDFQTAQEKQTKREDLKHKKKDLLSVSLRNRNRGGTPRESLLHNVEEELGLTSHSRRSHGESSEESYDHQPLDSVSMSSRLSQPSFPRNHRRRKKKNRPSSRDDGDKNIVTLVNNVLGSAPDSVKEDFAKGVVYKKTNDDRLVTIYEMEKNGAIQAPSSQEEDFVKVTNVQLVDPYGDEGRYTGKLFKSTGLPHGLGRFWYSHDDRTYEGEWRFGQWHGFGRSTCINGDVYEGEYRQDQRHGVGVYTWKDGKVYKGNFQHDRRHGRGIMTWPNGTQYDGGFVKGNFEGRGKMTYADGQVQVGEWIAGKFQDDGETEGEANRDLSSSAAAVAPDHTSEGSMSSGYDLPRHARISSSFSETSENTEQEWTCSMCTYVNTDPLHLSCAVCGNARITKRPVTFEEDVEGPLKSDSNERGDWVEIRNRNLV